VDVDRGTRAPEHIGNFSGGPIRVVVQHDGESLLRGKLGEGPHQLRNVVVRLVDQLLAGQGRHAQQIVRRDPERDLPRPRAKISHGFLVLQDQRERFGHRVAGRLAIAGEPHEGAPHLRGLLLIETGDPLGGTAHHRILDHTDTEGTTPENL
jgi:hypothetical protein